jgi:hypothetical protein
VLIQLSQLTPEEEQNAKETMKKFNKMIIKLAVMKSKRKRVKDTKDIF